MKAKLALENGTVFEGEGFGSTGEVTGEVVFNTSMTGYQEIFTDPSYCGQIVTLTYPLVGNYGINREDLESGRPQVSGVVVRESSAVFSNFRAQTGLSDWLAEHGVIAIEGLDTRMLTRMLRTDGALRGVISTADADDESLVRKAAASPLMNGLDLATKVTCRSPYSWDETDATPFALARSLAPERGGRAPVQGRRVRLRHQEKHTPAARPLRVRGYRRSRRVSRRGRYRNETGRNISLERSR